MFWLHDVICNWFSSPLITISDRVQLCSFCYSSLLLHFFFHLSFSVIIFILGILISVGYFYIYFSIFLSKKKLLPGHYNLYFLSLYLIGVMFGSVWCMINVLHFFAFISILLLSISSAQLFGYSWWFIIVLIFLLHSYVAC